MDYVRDGGTGIPFTVASLPLPTGAAADGTDATGITPPAGAVGIRGWLSGIFSLLSATLTVTFGSTTLVRYGGTLGAVGQVQQIIPARAGRKGWWLLCLGYTSNGQMIVSGTLWVDETGNTPSLAPPSIPITAGSDFQSPLGGSGSAAITVIPDTASLIYVAREWY